MSPLILLLALLLIPLYHAYTIIPTTTAVTKMTIRHAQRYGPSFTTSEGDDDDDEVFDRNARNNDAAFRQLLHQVIEASSSSSSSSTDIMTPRDQIPSLLGQNIELLVSMQRDQIETILSEALQSGGPENEQRVADALEFMLGFAETFVENMKALDDQNKQLLGKIIRAASAVRDDVDSAGSTNKEAVLDDLLESERDNLTPGFLRHLEGECERIANAPSTTPESLRLLQMLRTIQVRVVEELGKGLGDEALVLGQLLGYDDPRERIAVLRAGMSVRGVEFSQKMGKLTEKALTDFQRLGAENTDPELVERVKGIHEAIHEFLNLQNA